MSAAKCASIVRSARRVYDIYTGRLKLISIRSEHMELGSRIRELRMARGITQDELAQALHVTAQAVSKWETGVSIR